MNYCTNVFILKVLYLFKIIFKTLQIVVPLILIILITLDFYKAVVKNEEEFGNIIGKSIKRFIAALLVFFTPTIINAVYNTIGEDALVFSCIQNANPDVISQYQNNRVYELVETAKKTYDDADYSAAINAVYGLKDEKEKERLINELSNVKFAFEIKNSINNIRVNYTDEEYNRISKDIEKVLNSKKRAELYALLEAAKKYYEENISLTKPLDLPVGTFERSDFDSEMRYIEVIPEDATTNMPLVLYLHGLWSYASFSNKAKDYYITDYVESGSAYKGEKFIFVVPRFVLSQGDSRGMVTWYTSQGREQTKKLRRLIEFLVEKYGTDEKRIIITGVSLGGDGTWNMVETYPDLFAAAVPISGCASSDPKVSNFLSTAISTFYGTGYNESAYQKCVPTIYSKIKNAGGIITLEEKKGYGHGDMQKVYSDNNGQIFEWMLSQEKY